MQLLKRAADNNAASVQAKVNPRVARAGVVGYFVKVAAQLTALIFSPVRASFAEGSRIVKGRGEVDAGEEQAPEENLMSEFSASRFYAAIDVDSAFSQNIESLFTSFIATPGGRIGWHVDL